MLTRLFERLLDKPAEGSGAYRLHKLVGLGSFGRVILATEKETKRVVAIKACSRALLVSRGTVDRTLTEVAVLKMLDSPFVNKIIASFKTPSLVCIVLEFEQGGELYRLFKLKNGKLDPKSVRFYAAQITLALEAMHRLKVAFRDLKLENLLLNGKGNVKLCDLGLCKQNMTECDKGSTSLVGTLDYLAPELVAPGSEHGFAVDWWALGVVIHELLSGRAPYHSRSHSEQEIIQQIINDPVKLEQGLQPDVLSTLERLLDKNPRTRLGSTSGASEIKQSPMFSEFDWEASQSLALQPPWIPHFKSALDVSMFDPQFTSLPVGYKIEADNVGSDHGDDALWGADFPTIEDFGIS